MKFRAAKEWGEPDHNSGFRLIFTLTKVEYRLYVWTKRTNKTVCRFPFEFQRRPLPANFDTQIWPKRGRLVQCEN